MKNVCKVAKYTLFYIYSVSLILLEICQTDLSVGRSPKCLKKLFKFQWEQNTCKKKTESNDLKWKAQIFPRIWMSCLCSESIFITSDWKHQWFLTFYIQSQFKIFVSQSLKHSVIQQVFSDHTESAATKCFLTFTALLIYL